MSVTLSIITITYNNLEGLKNTIKSIDYSLDHFEHIIIDGSSTDGTIDFLKKSGEPFLWHSEVDNGIYDAMNKGLDKAQGNYVIFMNAGDSFYKLSTLDDVLSILLSEKPDILYGETMLIDSEGSIIGTRSQNTTRKLPVPLTYHDMLGGMMVCHQSFVTNKSKAPKYIDNNLSADIDWVIKCLKNSENILVFDQPIALYLTGGISDQKKIKSLADRFKVMQNHFGMWASITSHLKIILRYFNFKISTS